MNKFELTDSDTARMNSFALIEAYKQDQSFSGEITDTNMLQHICERSEFDMDSFSKYLRKHNQFSVFLMFLTMKQVKDISLYRELLTNKPSLVNKIFKDTWDNQYKAMTDILFVEFIEHVSKNNYGYMPAHMRSNEEFILSCLPERPELAWSFYTNVAFLKKAVKIDARILEHCGPNILGRIQIMRELCHINPECAKYAHSAVYSKAGATSLHNNNKRKELVLEWLTSTREKKIFKAKDMVPRVKKSNSCSQAAPKAKFKI